MQSQPAQLRDRQPGRRQPTRPPQESLRKDCRAAEKPAGKVALVTGGDSGIGHALALHSAREGADAVPDEHGDARDTGRVVLECGRRCLLLPVDSGDEARCRATVAAVVEAVGALDILVGNAAEQHIVDRPEELGSEQVEPTFRTDAFAYMYLTGAALRHLNDKGSIIDTSSVTGASGHAQRLEYAATKVRSRR